MRRGPSVKFSLASRKATVVSRKATIVSRKTTSLHPNEEEIELEEVETKNIGNLGTLGI